MYSACNSSTQIPRTPGSESRLQQGFERFLATPPQNRGQATSFKFVTECFFITQRALHVGLLPAVNTFINLSSELGKSKDAKIAGRNEDMLKLLSMVSKWKRKCVI